MSINKPVDSQVGQPDITQPQPEAVSAGCGMGWPEAKDRPGHVAGEYGMDYVAARRAADPNYAYGHDGKLWAIV